MRAFISILAVVLILFLIDSRLLPADFWRRLPVIEKSAGVLEKTVREVLAPVPLRTEKESPMSFLTRSGIIVWTNGERKTAELALLSENQKLNDAAVAKVQDMFAKQYFEHISPEGTAVGDLVEEVGYDYIAIGENLALGNFADDKELVKAWMESSGHRANILKPSYREIGVAARQGEFEGKTTWLAVQIFGRPRSDCQAEDESLKIKISANQMRLRQLESDLERLKIEIGSTRPRRGPEYSQKVEAYNALANDYNALAAETRTAIETYNSQVRLFNQCVVK